MAKMTTKALEGIERRMEGIDQHSMRYKILQSAKDFKVSWIALGQALYSAWKDKLYKDWGYMTFEAYTAKEVGIKKATAMKLLKSYYFLEKEEPVYLHKERAASAAEAASVPSYESVNLLRLAKSRKAIDEDDYATLKKEVFESGKDSSDVRKSLTGLIRQREELQPDEVRQMKRTSTLKRLLAILKTLRKDIEVSKMLPAAILKETSNLINKIESEIG